MGSGRADVDNMEELILLLLGRLVSGPLPPSLETNSVNCDKIGEHFLSSDFKGDFIGVDVIVETGKLLFLPFLPFISVSGLPGLVLGLRIGLSLLAAPA